MTLYIARATDFHISHHDTACTNSNNDSSPEILDVFISYPSRIICLVRGIFLKPLCLQIASQREIRCRTFGKSPHANQWQRNWTDNDLRHAPHICIHPCIHPPSIAPVLGCEGSEISNIKARIFFLTLNCVQNPTPFTIAVIYSRSFNDYIS